MHIHKQVSFFVNGGTEDEFKEQVRAASYREFAKLPNVERDEHPGDPDWPFSPGVGAFIRLSDGFGNTASLYWYPPTNDSDSA